jgi:polysaccharide pyruvyl transferase WcaK-like protein
MDRRAFVGAALATLASTAVGGSARQRPPRVLLRSSWQTVNIGDIAHTPGMLALLERHVPGAEISLWPNTLSAEVEALLTTRFPRLRVVTDANAQAAALERCDVFVHGSGPGLVGWPEADRARQAGIAYGFAGVTLSDEEIANRRDLLAGARFVFTRETASLAALRASGITEPTTGFGPDATFALDLRDDDAAERLLAQHRLEPGRFLCAVPRLRWTPYWEIDPERVPPNPRRSAVNEAFADRDHAKLREAIVAWVTSTGMRVFIVPEMTYAVPRLAPLLYDPLPDHIKRSVAVMDRYWLTAEAASVYARAAAVASFEMHSPIMAIAAGTPALHLRQPTDTRKGQMWRDVGLEDWLFEIDHASGQQIASRLVEVGSNLSAARERATRARAVAQQRMADMAAAIAQTSR